MKLNSDPYFYAVCIIGISLAAAIWWFSNDWSWIVTWGFLGSQIRLAYQTHREAQRLQQELKAEHQQGEKWASDQGVETILENIKQQRQQLSLSPPELCRTVLQELSDAHIAGEALDVKRLDAILRHQAMSLYAPLANRQTVAFMIGLLGTIVGLLLQVLIAQGMGLEVLFGEGFFTGAMMAATSTVQGIVTALYIRSCDLGLQKEFDTLIALLEGVFRRVFVPRMGGAAQSELERFADRIEGNLRSLLEGFLDEMTKKLETLLRELPSNVDSAISRLLEEKVGTKVEKAMEVFMAAMVLINGNIKQTEKALKEGTDALGIQIERLVGHPDETSKRLQETLVDATNIASTFEKIATKVGEITTAVHGMTDQLAVATPMSAAGPSQASSDLDQLIKEQDQQIRLVGDAIRELAGLVNNLGELDDRLKRQSEEIASSTNELEQQRRNLASNNEKIVQVSKELDALRDRVGAPHHQVQPPVRQGFFVRLFGRSRQSGSQP